MSLSSRLQLHVTGQQVLLELQLGDTDQGTERAAEAIGALANRLAADVLLGFIPTTQLRLTVQTGHSRQL